MSFIGMRSMIYYCRLWLNALCLVRRRSMIRRATIEDASRIAEISIFTKRMNYRAIFRNDKVSFGEMRYGFLMTSL